LVFNQNLSQPSSELYSQSQYSERAETFEVRVAGRFKMDRMIGSGSFGEIFMAKDIRDGRDVAVKFE
jgi:serine/threonine protein kinase